MKTFPIVVAVLSLCLSTDSRAAILEVSGSTTTGFSGGMLQAHGSISGIIEPGQSPMTAQFVVEDPEGWMEPLTLRIHITAWPTWYSYPGITGGIVGKPEFPDWVESDRVSLAGGGGGGYSSGGPTGIARLYGWGDYRIRNEVWGPEGQHMSTRSAFVWNLEFTSMDGFETPSSGTGSWTFTSFFDPNPVPDAASTASLMLLGLGALVGLRRIRT